MFLDTLDIAYNTFINRNKYPIDATHLFLYMTLTCHDISEGEPKPIEYVQDAWYQNLFIVTAFATLQ
jgi:hypothetical protein